MNRDTEHLLEDLRTVVTELEALLAQPAEHLQQAAANVEHTLHGLRRRLGELQAGIRGRVGSAFGEADRSVRESPWATLAIAAAATFLLGLALGSRDRSSPR